MRTDCEWFKANLEAYCSDELPYDEAKLAQTHLDSCASCARMVQELDDLDPLLKQVFQHRLAISRTHTPQLRQVRTWRLAASAAVILLLLVFGISILQRESSTDSAASDPSVTSPVSPPEAVGKKDLEESPIERAKPDNIPQPVINTSPEADLPVPDGPDFAVIDPAGYSTTLENYRGYVLVLGLWSASQPDTLENMNRIYETFSSDPQIRILGVASRRQDKAATIFPVVYNHGSRLLGLDTGEFVVLDKTGRQRLSGSLHTRADALIRQIRGEVETIRAR